MNQQGLTTLGSKLHLGKISGGSKGPKFLHFHAVFRKNWPNNRLAPPPLGNPGFATENSTPQLVSPSLANIISHSFLPISFLIIFLVARRATYVVDGRFFGHFFWKVEGSSAHTRESRSTHVCHVQLTCGKLLYGGGEPSHVAHVCHMCHLWQLTCMLLLYGGGEPSCVC